LEYPGKYLSYTNIILVKLIYNKVEDKNGDVMGRAYPKDPKIIVPRYAPDRLEGLLELIFPNHRLRQKIAKAFLEEVRKRGTEGFNEEEWIPFVIKVLGQDYPHEVKALMNHYEALEGEVSRITLQREITKKALELGLVDEGANLFNVYKSQYSIILKMLRRLGLIYKKEGAYYTSPHFGNVLEAIGRLWKDWRAGLVD